MTKLNAAEVRKVCLSEELNTETAKNASAFSGDVWLGEGQDRLLDALDFGFKDHKSGQHIFIQGLSGPAATEAIRVYLEKFKEENKEDLPEPRDWCYVYNFSSEANPALVNIKAGSGKPFKNKMEVTFFEKLQEAISNAVKDVEQKNQKEAVLNAITPLFEQELFGKMKENNPALRQYFEGLKQYCLEHFAKLLPDYNAYQAEKAAGQTFVTKDAKDYTLPFKVNVFVENSKNADSPVVVENNATYENLICSLDSSPVVTEGVAVMSSTHMDIRAGSLPQANGGYLVVDLYDLLVNSNAYSPTFVALMRALKNGEIYIESPMPMARTKPQPMPLQAKLVVVGPSGLWSQFLHHNPSFGQYGIKAEVIPQVGRTLREVSSFAAWARQIAKQQQLGDFDDSAIAKLVEQASRLSGSQNKMAVDFEQFHKIMHEASYIAGRDSVTGKHVQKAIEKQFYRSSFYYDYMRDRIKDGSKLFDFEGKKVGQINGLVVYTTSEVSFGMPGRITAQAALGKLDFINIHREAKMSGPTMNKADTTIEAYFRSTYGKKFPVSFTASVSFEQSYGRIDGDSASLAQLFAILSAVSSLPIRQDVAITGSMDQLGNVQPIGGVNEKIEGFFDAVCAKGQLTGKQGVIIPHQNKEDLMLREDIAKAVEEETFHVWAISNIAEGVEILMEAQAGERDEQGNFPDDSLNNIVENKLKEMAETARDFFSGK